MPLPQSSGSARVPAEHVLIVKIFLALGLALLLVVGAWSTSHGEADAHSALCLAPGASAHADDPATQVATPDSVTPDAGSGLAAVLCCFLLAILFVRLLGRGSPVLLSPARRAVSPPRAGPHRHLLAPDLIRLSISRT